MKVVAELVKVSTQKLLRLSPESQTPAWHELKTDGVLGG